MASREELEESARRAIDLEMELFMDTDSSDDNPVAESIRRALASVTRDIQDEVQVQISEINQRDLMNSIEIVGLPEDLCENVHDVADVLSQIMHLEIRENTIRGFETADQFTGPALGQEQPVNVVQRALVVHLDDRNLRNLIMDKAQAFQLSYPPSGRVYIYEHLTHLNRFLFRKACSTALDHGIEQVWVRDGEIFARRTKYSNIYQITSSNDISRMYSF